MLGTPITPATGVTSRVSGRSAQTRRKFPMCGCGTPEFGRSADPDHRPHGPLQTHRPRWACRGPGPLLPVSPVGTAVRRTGDEMAVGVAVAPARDAYARALGRGTGTQA